MTTERDYTFNDNSRISTEIYLWREQNIFFNKEKSSNKVIDRLQKFENEYIKYHLVHISHKNPYDEYF